MVKGLSDEDIRILQRWINESKRRNPRGSARHSNERYPDDNEGNDLAPEVYVAKIPSDGINGLETCTTGTGTPGCMGTGTGTGDGYDEPGLATCDLYVIDQSDSPDDLRPIGKDVPVYNVNPSALTSGYVPVMRDKFGRWLAVTGESTCNTSIMFEVTAAGPLLGTGVVECDYVTATVKYVSCCNDGTEVGDEVLVWDPTRCKFAIPLEVLIGIHGWAIKTEKVIPDLGEPYDCEDDLANIGRCIWVVQSLCCGEEIFVDAAS
jgi:hypothetical protein